MLAALGTVVVLALGATVWVFTARDFAFTEERVTIPGPHGGELHGVLAVPKGEDGPYGLVVFVHGDGPVNADSDEKYKPLWDSFAQDGFASLSWDKPGVDDAPGNWLHQSMQDRATEVDTAIAWAHTREDVDPTRMGAWGIGQAGWILPEVARARPDLRFLTMVDPAVNWIDRREHEVRSRLEADDATPTEIDAALRRNTERNELLKAGADYRAYRRARIDAEPVSRDRWSFLRRNLTADSTGSLSRIPIPTLLLVGGEDRNVDVTRSERVYRAKMRGDLLTVKRFPEATHAMMRDDIEYRPEDVRVAGQRALAPKSVYVPGYLEVLRVFAKRNTV